jgi:hypothetical protein
MANVRLLRMVSGEDVVCTVIKNTEDTITIKDAIVAIPTGQGQLGFAPWSPIISKEESEITISDRFVIYQAEPDSSVVEQYNTMFGNVIAPKKQSIIV